MRNTLSFCNTMFLFLFVGKIGHVGTLGNVNWFVVFIPLILDAISDFLMSMGYINKAILKIKAFVIQRKLNKISEQMKKMKG